MLQLEISESDLMHYSAGGSQALHELHELGVKITIDNFGAGLFSLQALKELPIYELKMDRSLVKCIEEGSDGGNIASAIIALGHILDRQVVAEGVETKGQLGFLRKHDSDAMLGYLSSPPVPADEITRQLKNQKLHFDGGET
jgi:EAL domain-containing protein (putative c-di-GMP-specific phosphodiesterase class I)